MTDWNLYGPWIMYAGMIVFVPIAIVLVVGKAPDLAGWLASRRERKHVPDVDEAQWRDVQAVTQKPCPQWCDPLLSGPAAWKRDCRCNAECGVQWCGKRQAGAEAGLA